MSFVNELISEDDKQKIDWTKFKAYSYSNPHSPWKWTIDRVRDVFFIPLEHTGYDDTNTRPDIFVLYWKKTVVRVEARVTGTGEGKFWDTLFWRVSKVDIPVELQSQRDEILSTLKEAFCAHGWLFDEHAKSVNVLFEDK